MEINQPAIFHGLLPTMEFPPISKLHHSPLRKPTLADSVWALEVRRVDPNTFGILWIHGQIPGRCHGCHGCHGQVRDQYGHVWSHYDLEIPIMMGQIQVTSEFRCFFLINAFSSTEYMKVISSRKSLGSRTLHVVANAVCATHGLRPDLGKSIKDSNLVLLPTRPEKHLREHHCKEVCCVVASSMKKTPETRVPTTPGELFHRFLAAIGCITTSVTVEFSKIASILSRNITDQTCVLFRSTLTWIGLVTWCHWFQAAVSGKFFTQPTLFRATNFERSPPWHVFRQCSWKLTRFWHDILSGIYLRSFSLT